MKKLLLLIMTLALVLSLAACGGTAEPEAAPEPTEEPELNLQTLAPVTPDPAEAMAASQSDAEALDGTRPASDTDAVLDEDAYETAKEFIGREAGELIAELGEPAETRYAASCLEEGAEDGMLFFEGFYVWTVKGEDSEIIHDVYLTD